MLKKLSFTTSAQKICQFFSGHCILMHYIHNFGKYLALLASHCLGAPSLICVWYLALHGCINLIAPHCSHIHQLYPSQNCQDNFWHWCEVSLSLRFEPACIKLSHALLCWSPILFKYCVIRGVCLFCLLAITVDFMIYSPSEWNFGFAPVYHDILSESCVAVNQNLANSQITASTVSPGLAHFIV